MDFPEPDFENLSPEQSVLLILVSRLMSFGHERVIKMLTEDVKQNEFATRQMGADLQSVEK